MKKEHLFFVLILFLIFLSIYLLYQILSPFLSSIIWAILLAIIFYPISKKVHLLLRKKAMLSAVFMTFLVFIVIVLPFSLLLAFLANEIVGVYHQVEEMAKSGQLQNYLEQFREIPFIKSIFSELGQYINVSQIEPIPLLLKNIQKISTFIFSQTTALIKGFSTFVGGFFFTLLSLYYLFKDGEPLFKRLKEMVPLPSQERDLLFQRFKEMIYATIYGGILVAMIQGFLGGLSFWILRLSSPIFWGMVMTFLSFIPIGGTALIWAPAAILLFIKGAILKGAILMGVGILIISTVDNFLRPLLISSRTHIHPLILFFSVLGGLQAFGLIGLVAGPLIVTFFLTLVEIYIQGTKF